LTISLKKTKVMYTPAPGTAYTDPTIKFNDTVLDTVDSFIYLGSSLSKDGTLDSEIEHRLKKKVPPLIGLRNVSGLIGVFRKM